ncbi:NUDIX hydrolase [Cryptosporangium minutisporangium]|uniref:NUDIX domain-containing protein n=1 Tax=Cryptosporangium minutisporangium TaxID=113569 RepID=A0ABP6SZH5_9ACTN
MARTEYLNDPAAPAPNSIVVAATAFVAETDGRILLIQRADTGRWALPGGVLGLGERVTDTAVRETREETGIDILITGLIGIYSNPRHVLAFSDGTVRQQFSLCFRAHPLGGSPSPSAEFLDVRWVDPGTLRELDIHPDMLVRIGHALSNRPLPYLG